jgi:hypothetical protein
LTELSPEHPQPPALVAEFLEILTIELSINSMTFNPDYSAIARLFDFCNESFVFFILEICSSTLFLTPIGNFISIKSSLLSIAKSFSVSM